MDAPAIKAELERRGFRLGELARSNGYHSSATTKTLRAPWPAVELIIARALMQSPATVWPERYDRNGNSLYGRINRSRPGRPGARAR